MKNSEKIIFIDFAFEKFEEIGKYFFTSTYSESYNW